MSGNYSPKEDHVTVTPLAKSQKFQRPMFTHTPEQHQIPVRANNRITKNVEICPAQNCEDFEIQPGVDMNLTESSQQDNQIFNLHTQEGIYPEDNLIQRRLQMTGTPKAVEKIELSEKFSVMLKDRASISVMKSREDFGIGFAFPGQS
jgi:hypothetical protein